MPIKNFIRTGKMIVELELTKDVGRKGSFIRLKDDDGNEDIMRLEEWLKIKEEENESSGEN